MSSWDVIIIVGCAVGGFILVSLIIEAAGWRTKPATRQAEDAGKDSASSGQRSDKKPAWHEILGVSPTASTDEIKIAFRERARQYHPDRVEGLGPELREIADAKMKQLNEAYDFGLKTR
jgi:DnaJ-domain-containing protein 1